MTTLAAAMLEVARAIAHVRAGVTSAAGTPTTLIDASADEPDDFWNNGLIWFLTGALAGKTASISDYAKGTGTFTFPTFAPPAAPGAGASYGAMRAEFARADLVSAINLALDDLGSTPQADDTTLAVSGQEEYDLPQGVMNVCRVLVATNATDPYAWKKNLWWEERDGVLYFDPGKAPTANGVILRLVYMGASAKVALDADEISPYIPLERLKWAGAVNALRIRYTDVGKSAPAIADRFKEAAAQDAHARLLHPIFPLPHDPHYSGW